MENKKYLNDFGLSSPPKPFPVSNTVYHTVELIEETGHVPEIRKKVDAYVNQLIEEEAVKRKNEWNQLFSSWEPVALLDFYIKHKIRLSELEKEIADYEDEDEEYHDGLEWDIASEEQLLELARPYINKLFTKEN